jgi:thiamine pyrophosphokinase
LANVLLLSRLDIRATLFDEQNECTLIRPHVPYTWRTDPGEIVSLLPITGDTTGVSTRGLHWVLDGERLLFGDTRGVSNEASADEASVSIASGLMLLTRHFPGGSGAQL